MLVLGKEKNTFYFAKKHISKRAFGLLVKESEKQSIVTFDEKDNHGTVDPADAVCSAFLWGMSKMGHAYWAEVNKRYIKKLEQDAEYSA